MNATFPKLLVASEFPPNAPGGGPAVLRQMLKDWPVEKLFWWSCLPETNLAFGQKVAGHAVATIPAKLYPHRRARRMKSWLLENFWSPWAANHFQRALKNFQPEVIWVIPHGWSAPPLANVLLKSNFHFHVTVQDFMDMKSNAIAIGTERSRRWVALAEQLFQAATTRDATSHPMIAELLAATGCAASQMLHAGIEPDELNGLAGERENVSDKIQIAYAGTIHVEKEFALFVSALEKIRGQLPRPVSLELFGNHSYRDRDWFKSEWMNERGNLPEPQLRSALKQCDWGFSPMALHDDDPRYNRFSFPTKFISYLAAGLPVITLSYPQNGVAKMATQYRVGLCTSAADAGELGAQLLSALSEPNPKAKFRAEILRCASVEFNAGKMRVTLYGCFRKCAAAGVTE